MRLNAVVPILNGVRYIERFIEMLRQRIFQDSETIFLVNRKDSDGSRGIDNDHDGERINSNLAIQGNDVRLGGPCRIELDHAMGELMSISDYRADICGREGIDICNILGYYLRDVVFFSIFKRTSARICICSIEHISLNCFPSHHKSDKVGRICECSIWD